MTLYTAAYALPYPEDGDPPNGPGQVAALAAAVETALAGILTGLRHQFIQTQTDVTTSTTANYVSNAGGVTITGTYPKSGIVAVAVGGQPDSGDGFLAFEIRDTNSAGTLRHAAADTEAMRNGSATGPNAVNLTVVTGLPTSGPMFVRAMFKAASGAPLWRYHQMAVMPSP